MEHERLECFAAAGGVSLNSRLRSQLAEMAKRRGWQMLLAPAAYCADNAAMVAAAAALGLGLSGSQAMEQDACPALSIGE